MREQLEVGQEQQTDPAVFVRANTGIATPPRVPEIPLHLGTEAFTLWARTEAELDRDGLPPPFWAFAWAGGQALARYVLDHPQQVRGRSVLDLASGSGLVAIAAARAGAESVTATEVDPFAVAAIGLNARRNGVAVHAALEDFLDRDAASTGSEVVLAGDVFYEQPMADRVLAFLGRAHAAGCAVLVGDPGRNHLPGERFEVLARYEVPVPRSLEDSDVKRVMVSRPAW